MESQIPHTSGLYMDTIRVMLGVLIWFYPTYDRICALKNISFGVSTELIMKIGHLKEFLSSHFKR